jgi:hypothetical protein
MSLNQPVPKHQPDQPGNRKALMPWLKRLGLAGFLFFAIKGMLWILVPVLVAKGCMAQ